MAGGWRRLAGVLMVIVLVSGCARTISGTARGQAGGAQNRSAAPSSTAPPGEGSATDLLGDLTTLDPCSLTDPGEFAEFGPARFGVLDSLDDCLIEITASTPEPVDLYVGSLDRAEALPELGGRKSTDLPGGLKVVEYDSDSSYCNQLLVFADGVTLSVNASLYQAEEPRLCDMVRTGVDKVVEVIRDGEVGHRDFRGNSLGRIDPCEVVSDGALAAVAGLTAATPKSYPARHGCAWTAADNATRLRVMFTAGPAPKPSAPGATATTLASRPTVLSPTPDAGEFVFCGAQTAHVPLAAAGQSGLVEIAAVFVRMRKGEIDKACSSATEIATAVWQRLPRP